MQIFHPVAPVSSREISPDQQTQHIHCLQRVRVFSSLSILFTASLCIYFHSALTALKKSPQLWSLLHLDPIFHPLHHPFAHTHQPSTSHSPTHTHSRKCCCPCAYSERNGLLSLVLPVTEGHAGLPPPNKASAIVIICIDA